jgi:hypothetical protein
LEAVLDLHSAGSDSSRRDDVAFSCCTNALVISFTAISRAAGLLLCSNSSFAATMFSMGVALTSSRFLSTYGGFLIYIVKSQDFIKFWGKIFAFVLLEIFGNSQGFKTFLVYLKALFENYLKTSIYFLKNFFEKEQVSKCYFHSSLIKPMQACLQRNVSQRCFLIY